MLFRRRMLDPHRALPAHGSQRPKIAFSLLIRLLTLLVVLPGCSTSPSTEKSTPWHIDLAMRGSHPKLASTAQQLDRRLDQPLKIDWANVFDEPYTPIDRRTDLGLATWYVGVGRQPCAHFIWTFYLGGGLDQDINHQRFLNTRLEVDFRYGYYYTGLAGEFYPWALPEPSDDRPLHDILGESRPFLLGGIEAGYVSGEGEGDYRVTGVTLWHDELKVRDWLTSINLGAGWSFPISQHLALTISGDYRFHAYRPDEYNGWNWTTALRIRF